MTGEVVIAGVGLSAPSGSTTESVLDAVLAADALPADAGHEVGPAPGYPGQDPATSFAMRASTNAMQRATSALDGEAQGGETGVLVASVSSNIDVIARVAAGVAAESYRVVRPTEVLTIAGTQVTASLSSWFDARAFAYGSGTGHAAGADALSLASTSIRRSRARRVLVVGTETPGVAAQRLVDETSGPSPLFIGAAAVVLASADEHHGPAIAVGPARRGGSITDIVAAHSRDAPGLVFVPAGADAERTGSAAELAAAYPEARIVDTHATLGDAQGAAGVVQAVLGAAWLSRHPESSVLTVTGSPLDRHLVSRVLDIRRKP